MKRINLGEVLVLTVMVAGLAWGSTITEAEKQLPLVQDTDVVVVGGSSGAVAAAQQAAANGAKVFLVAPRPYLGDDMAGRLNLRAAANDDTSTELYASIFKEQATEATPFKIKRTLDEALIKAGVPFLTGAFATDVLSDESGALAGVMIASRSGRQALRAKVVIDATERGLIARAAGAKATPFPSGKYTFQRILISGEAPPKAENMRVSELLGVYPTTVNGVGAPKGMPKEISGRMYVCEITLPMKDGSARSFAEAEQQARDQTFTKTQLDASDRMAFLPPDQFHCRATSAAPWKGVGALDMGVFQPADVDHLFVLGPLADISRDAAQALMMPGNLMAAGVAVGKAAAAQASARKTMGKVALGMRGDSAATPQAGAEAIGEGTHALPYYLSNTNGTVLAGPRALPTLASCDVVVVGAGTGGAPAGISAARQGAKTIVCEYLYQMGGVQTEGMIGRYWFGNRCGFTAEIDEGVAKMGSVLAQAKSEWYRRECRKAGAEIWFGTVATGVVKTGDKLTGVIVVMPDGTRGVITCKVAIDATGNADLAAMAGEETEFMRSDEIAVQGVGQTIRSLGMSYANNDVSFVDDTDASDLSFFSLRARMSITNDVWDQSQIVNSRERRRLVGVFYMTPMDVMNSRTYPDVVVQTKSNFDSHGHTVCEQFFIDDPGHKAMTVNLPYRCFLPKRVDGLLVVGLGISAHRDAMPILRMQPDVQNQGYAAGVAAALSIKANVTARQVDIKALQQHLIEKNVLPPQVLKMKDSFPLSAEQFQQAVATLTNAYSGLSVLLTDPSRSIPLLREALTKATDKKGQLKYAHVLGMLGAADGEDLLIDQVKAMSWDKGWNFRGMGQFGRSVSMMDSYIIALGRAKSKKALPVLTEKARLLTATSEFSHFRAVSLAFEGISDPAGAPVLAELLALEGMSGHAISMDNAKGTFPTFSAYASSAGDKERNKVLRELSLARALYRLGDHQGLGEKTLKAYARDPRGMYANHAKLVLAK
jgi:ribulose 1,5-bisphosphate synthetase/thiazole synthase